MPIAMDMTSVATDTMAAARAILTRDPTNQSECKEMVKNIPTTWPVNKPNLFNLEEYLINYLLFDCLFVCLLVRGYDLGV